MRTHLARGQTNVVVVAVANKLARIAWAVCGVKRYSIPLRWRLHDGIGCLEDAKTPISALCLVAIVAIAFEIIDSGP